MGFNRTKNSLRNTSSGIINRVINLLVPFVIRTIIIQKLGSEYLGLGSLFTSIIQVLNLSELGIGNALVFSMYKPVKEDDQDTIISLLNLYKNVYRIIGIIILTIGLILTPFITYIIDMESIEGTSINVYLLFLIYLVNTVLSYCLFAYKRSILIANQRQDIVSRINSIVHIAMYVFQIIIIYATKNYYIYIILLPIFTIIDNCVTAFYANKKYKYILRKNTEKASLKPILNSIKYLLGHKIGAVIISSADSIIISSFLPLITLTTYSNYFYVISALNGFINVGYNAILASVGNSVITEKKEKLYSLFNELSFILFYIVSFFTACLYSLYQPFMQIWMGEKLMFTGTTVLFFTIYFYTWQIRVMGLIFKDAAGMWKHDALKPYVGMVINLLLNFILVQTIGVNGVLIATIVVMVFVYFPWETLVLFKSLFMRSPLKYIGKHLLYCLITISITFITYYISNMIEVGSVIHLIIRAALTFIISNVLLILCCIKMKEFKTAITRIKKSVFHG